MPDEWFARRGSPAVDRYGRVHGDRGDVRPGLVTPLTLRVRRQVDIHGGETYARVTPDNSELPGDLRPEPLWLQGDILGRLSRLDPLL